MARLPLRHVLRTGVFLLVLGIGTYLATGFAIGAQVERAIAVARAHHPGAPVEALIETASDASIDLSVRDSAVWALGQLGVPEALPTLRALETGEPCDHARDVCQRGVRKALRGCAGGTNVSAPVWRRGDLTLR